MEAEDSAGPAFDHFGLDPGPLVAHASKMATHALQSINLGEQPVDALATLFAQGTLLGLAIAEGRAEAVERLIEEAS